MDRVKGGYRLPPPMVSCIFSSVHCTSGVLKCRKYFSITLPIEKQTGGILVKSSSKALAEADKYWFPLTSARTSSVCTLFVVACLLFLGDF